MNNADGGPDTKAPIPTWVWTVSAVAAVAIIGIASWWFISGQKAAVPDVTGRDQTAATQALRDAGLELGRVSTEATAAQIGTVVAQDPTAGAEAAKGSSVNLTISGGPAKVEVPVLKGLTRIEAEKALAKLGLESVQTAEYDSYVSKDSVIDQLPPAGELTAPGSTVGILLSLGVRPAAPFAVPDVKGRTRAQARTILIDAGLNPDFLIANDPKAPVGTVAGQNPASGVKVAPDTDVLVIVSNGAAPPTAVAVPGVVGKRSQAARTALETAGLRAETHETYSAKPRGEVVAQAPVAGTKVATGTIVGMMVSAGPAPTKPPANPPTYPTPPGDAPTVPDTPTVETVQVPKVVGLDEKTAISTLRDKGLEAVVVPYASDSVPKGTVVSQLPSASEYVLKGYSVLLTISTGPLGDAVGDVPTETPVQNPSEKSTGP
jgi:eukaryotic-like serine/threonine-protein kinase